MTKRQSDPLDHQLPPPPPPKPPPDDPPLEKPLLLGVEAIELPTELEKLLTLCANVVA